MSSAQRRASALVLLAATLAVFLLCLAVLLSLSPLNELPDTFCQSVVNPPSGDGCSSIVSRRWQWIIVVLVLASLFATFAALARRAGNRRRSGAETTAAALMLASAALGLIAAAYLTIGKNHGECGSTLSRVDEHGEYDPGRPADCASSYADSRSTAWTFGLVGLSVFLVAGGIEFRERRAEPGLSALPIDG